jgi:hypothetical protein
MEKANKEKHKEFIHKKADKRLHYAKIVKEMHWPEISDRK